MNGHLTRRVTITPSMCGSSSLVFGQVGDWTWEAVQAASGVNVHAARNADGTPSYLSFYYFHTMGSEGLHPTGLTFGDEVQVTSRVFDFGRYSVLTLHRLSLSGDDDVLEPEEFYGSRREGRMYVENLNRWITRGTGGGNEGLVESSPEGFQHGHLPALPASYSPRGLCATARSSGTFFPGGVPGYTPVRPPHVTTYPLDVVRDLNGVGLTYFAAYFSIVDTALLRLWRELGRDDRRFLRRVVLDHRLGYFGNADPGATFTITVRLWRKDGAGDEVADVAVRDRDTGRLLAVAGVHLLVDET